MIYRNVHSNIRCQAGVGRTFGRVFKKKFQVQQFHTSIPIIIESTLMDARRIAFELGLLPCLMCDNGLNPHDLHRVPLHFPLATFRGYESLIQEKFVINLSAKVSKLFTARRFFNLVQRRRSLVGSESNSASLPSSVFPGEHYCYFLRYHVLLQLYVYDFLYKG